MAVKGLNGLQRGLEVLEYVATRQPVAAGDMATSLGLDRSALQRVLVTLHAGGWIRPGDHGWELGSRPLVLFASASSHGALVARARDALGALRDETGETAFLAVAADDRMVVADVVESRHLARISPQPGLVIDADLSAAVLAVAAFLPDDEAARLTRQSVGRRSVVKELTTTRDRGWSLHTGEVHSGVTSIAAPVFDGRRRPIAALVITGPTGRLEPRSLTALAEKVRRAADTISMSQAG